jgi:hypothetical protein
MMRGASFHLDVDAGREWRAAGPTRHTKTGAMPSRPMIARPISGYSRLMVLWLTL